MSATLRPTLRATTRAALSATVRAMRRTLLATLVALCLASPCAAQGDAETLAARVKAAYLYKFTEYVEWPAGTFRAPAAPLVIGVLGDGDVADELIDATRGRKSHGHSIEVRRLRDANPSPNPSPASRCCTSPMT